VLLTGMRRRAPRLSCRTREREKWASEARRVNCGRNHRKDRGRPNDFK
jgi:hypothetical protein